MVHIIIINLSAVIFGIAALLMISSARKKLSPGSLRIYLDNFSVCLAFVVIFSMWQTTRSIFHVNINVEGLTSYPEYLFILFAYLGFIVASYRVLKISEEFGFKDEGKRIQQIIESKLKNKSTNKSSKLK